MAGDFLAAVLAAAAAVAGSPNLTPPFLPRFILSPHTPYSPKF